VLLGILASFIIWSQVNAFNETADKAVVIANLRFDPKLFFHLILPTIIFPSGYNMRRKKFFRNIKTIFKFGFVGTAICFCLYTTLLSYADKYDMLVKWDVQTQSYVSLAFNNFEILSISALLCSSDVISTISQVSFEDQPGLYSVIYGESVFNDIVSIVLFNIIEDTYENEYHRNYDTNISFSTSFELFGAFVSHLLASIGIGFTMGCISSLIFKVFRSLSHSPITETLLLFVMALLTYYVCESISISSGIISLLTCGITMGHYTWYNLSP